MRVIISGGGTGGHIYPAIAIAGALKAKAPNTKILFVGAKGKMEMEKVPAAGYAIRGLPITGIQRELSWQNLGFPFRLVSSILQARRIVREFQPDIAIGVGGYASGPLLYAASGAKIPCLIQEQNAFAGLTNRWLASRVQRFCVAYEGMEQFFPANKIVLTGNPVRQDVLDLSNKQAEAWAYFQLKPGPKTILVFGGSQGARRINESISQGIDQIVEAGFQLIWQTGRNAFVQDAKQAHYESVETVKKLEFINRMDLAYAIADVVVARAGASTVSELCIAAKPSILSPLPSAAEDHQTEKCPSSLVE
ncbi:MAG: undecaprenyldiphospho-muramoylpentapeptide beta-N-acetylglucosaminyltransferase, partial [Bacteroidia bacterium]|nr:undecaprenyldiphospho-muramoylpentapeptide beta-N-acetylglucosaminyltransferase [Bacteroidia bacterium]